MENIKELSIKEIANIIYSDWTLSKVSYSARPYLDAMTYLNTIDDTFMLDSGKSIVRYFLANASQWRGEVAKEIKAELKRRVK
jgi:hypothetical protein